VLIGVKEGLKDKDEDEESKKKDVDA